MNTQSSYILRAGKETAPAILLEWTNGHTAKFCLYGPLGPFRNNNWVLVNFNTMEMRLLK